MTNPQHEALVEVQRELRRLLAHVEQGGPHEWGYREITDGSFIENNWPFEVAAILPAAIAALSATAATPSDEEVRLRAALEAIANQKPERDRPDDYNRGWEAARYAARNIARAALEPQAKDV